MHIFSSALAHHKLTFRPSNKGRLVRFPLALDTKVKTMKTKYNVGIQHLSAGLGLVAQSVG
jgi:hypothetical protein